MRHPTTHRFLKWLGPSLAVFLGAVVGLQAALASTYPEIKRWGEDVFYSVWPLMTGFWFIFLAVLFMAGYLWALVYTGQSVPAEPLNEEAEYQRRSTERRVEVRLKQDQARETDAAIIEWWDWFVAERNRQIEARKKDE